MGLSEIQKMLGDTAYTCKPLTAEEREKRNAENYNMSVGTLDDGYNCKICLNKGIVMRACQTESGAWITSTRVCECQKVRNSIRKMKASGLKNIITDYTFQKFEDTEDWQKALKSNAEDYAKNPSGWFFIGGQSGLGKTHLCTAICREFLLGGKQVQYMMWRDDIIKLKSSVNEAEKYTELIKPYKNAEVLYVDDLFKTGKTDEGKKQRPSVADINIAFELLNYRYNNPQLLTIVSSECSIDEILDLDEAVGGRIAERACGHSFSVAPDMDKNYRLKGSVIL